MMNDLPPLSDLDTPGLDEFDEIEPTRLSKLPDPPAVEPLTRFEIDSLRRLASIEGHLSRNDSLIMQMQLDSRRLSRKLAERIDARIAPLAEGIDDIKKLLKGLLNGGSHGH